MLPQLQQIFSANPVTTITGKSGAPVHLGDILSFLFPVIIFVAAFLMIFWMAWGIFEYIFAGGDKERLGRAQKRITWAIVGFVFVVISFVLSQFVREMLPPAF